MKKIQYSNVAEVARYAKLDQELANTVTEYLQ